MDDNKKKNKSYIIVALASLILCLSLVSLYFFKNKSPEEDIIPEEKDVTLDFKLGEGDNPVINPDGELVVSDYVIEYFEEEDVWSLSVKVTSNLDYDVNIDGEYAFILYDDKDNIVKEANYHLEVKVTKHLYTIVGLTLKDDLSMVKKISLKRIS